MHMAFKELVTSSRYSAIILAARWQNDEIGKLVRTVNYLKPATDRVYVLGPVVEYDRPLPRLLALAQLHGAQDLLDASRELPRIRQLDRRMHLAMGQLGGNVRYLSVLQAMCSGKKCVTTTPLGVPVQFDYGHLTYDGAAHVIQQMLQKELLRLG
jgi:hypothetical protein